MPLDPDNLTPAASLNRVRLVSGSRVVLPASMEGRTASELLSSRAFEALLQETQAGPNPSAARRAAEWAFGERLGYLIATLKFGEPGARAARDEWEDSYWSHWAAIEHVEIAGGLGSHTVALTASKTLAGLQANCTVSASPYATSAPLVGAARSLRVDDGAALVIDYGGTFIKRAVARYQQGALAGLARLDDLASPGSASRTPESLSRLLAAALDECKELTGIEPVSVAMSVASYIRDNHFLAPPHEGFVDVSRVENLGRWLSEEVSVRVGRTVSVRLIHDGTAAALAASPSRATAVITMGTALGVGFARGDATGIAPLSKDFRITAALAAS